MLIWLTPSNWSTTPRGLWMTLDRKNGPTMNPLSFPWALEKKECDFKAEINGHFYYNHFLEFILYCYHFIHVSIYEILHGHTAQTIEFRPIFSELQ